MCVPSANVQGEASSSSSSSKTRQSSTYIFSDLSHERVESLFDPLPRLGRRLHEWHRQRSGKVLCIGQVNGARRQIDLVAHHFERDMRMHRNEHVRLLTNHWNIIGIFDTLDLDGDNSFPLLNTYPQLDSLDGHVRLHSLTGGRRVPTCSRYCLISSKDFALLTANTQRKPSPPRMY